jgi:hypothetical protein
LEWCKQFKYDPIKPLIESSNAAVFYFTRRDLLLQNVEPAAGILWNLPAAQRIINKQQPGGYWIYPGKGEDYFLLAMFQNLHTLVYQYGFDRNYPAIVGRVNICLPVRLMKGISADSLATSTHHITPASSSRF